MSFGLYVLGCLIVTGGPIRTLSAESVVPSSDEILARLESETNRRHIQLTEYSSSRQYTLQNRRFGKQAAVAVLMSYREIGGEQYTILTRSGSDKLNGIIDKVLATEVGASLPPENARHQITSANYRVRLLGTEVAAGRSCYVLELAPKVKSRFLILGKAWVDAGSYAVVRIEGQFAASISLLVGAPHISEEFMEVHGFWLPAHVRSVTSSFLLGLSQLDIRFSNYQFAQASALLQYRAGIDHALSAAGHRVSRKLVTFPHNPVACSSQTQTTMTTTTFNIVLMLEAIGIYLLIRYNATPTMINTTTRFNKGIFLLLQPRKEQSVAQMPSRRVRSCEEALGVRAWLVKLPGLAPCAVPTN